MKMKINVVVKVKVPKVPNFLFLEGGGEPMPLDAFTKKGLAELADEWKLNLLARAEEMKKIPRDE